MPFLSHLDTRVYKPGEFVLLENFGFEFQLQGHERYQLWAPRGFITDFASVPWIVQVMPGFDVNGASRFAAAIHDWLYCNNGRVSVFAVNPITGKALMPTPVTFSRAECDEIFATALFSTGTDPFTRPVVERRFSETQVAMFWMGVRAGGWMYWNKRKNGLVLGYDLASVDEVQALEQAA